MPGRKSLRESEKEERRQVICSAAAELFRSGDFDEIRMMEIAEKAGLAKGTLFLYFETKEELFLELLVREYETWFAGIDTLLATPQAGPDFDWEACVLAYISGSLVKQEELFRLVAILHPVLERNISYEAAVRFKKFLSGHIRKTGGLLEHVLPALGGGRGAKLLVQLHALIVGFSNIARPAPVLRSAIENEELDEFTVDFRSWLDEAVRIFFTGLLSLNGGNHGNRRSDAG